MPKPLKIIRGSENAPIAPLAGKTVAVIGFGNQGHAHALNLRESGVRVIVGNRGGTVNAKHAAAKDFRLLDVAAASAEADLVILALPDEVQPQVFERNIAPSLKRGATIGFLHGFNIRFDLIKPPVHCGVIMVAPKGPGKTLRDRFVQGLGIPCLLAVHQESPTRDAESLGLAWANGIGCARAGIIYTSFRDETDTDLFGEQSVLCGGMTSLILAAFETLVKAGYPPELAYLECCHEVKQIADLIYERGLAEMMQAISNTAEFGAYQAGPTVVDDRVRAAMHELLARIQSGEFAKGLLKDHAAGFKWFAEQRERLKKHLIEAAGATIRGLMTPPHPPSPPVPTTTKKR